MAAWSGFHKHLGIIERLADHCPVLRTSPNAAPVREGLHSFLLGALVMGLNPGHHTEASNRGGIFVPGGASGRKRTATHAQTGGQSRLVGGVKRLLRKAADVVGGNCAAVGIPRQLSAPALPSNHR